MARHGIRYNHSARINVSGTRYQIQKRRVGLGGIRL